MVENVSRFYLTKPVAGYGAGSYTDPHTGEYKYVSVTKNPKTNEPIPYRFVFYNQPGGRTITVPNTWKDSSGQSMAEYLRTHPECEGSPTNTGQLTYFKEMDLEKDAELELGIQTKVLEAKNIAAALKGEKLKYISVLIGETSEKVSKQMVSVLKYAELSPEPFLKLVNDPDVDIRAILREGVNKGVIIINGSLHRWENTSIGADEDGAVATLKKDKDLLTAIKRSISLKK
jgi:hypothetical protein